MRDERDDEDPVSAVFRAAISGRPALHPRTSQSSGVWAPGRGSLEWSVLFAALGLLAPVMTPAAAVFALRARRSGNPRWLAALLSSGWCLILGVFLRNAVGMGLLP